MLRVFLFLSILITMKCNFDTFGFDGQVHTYVGNQPGVQLIVDEIGVS